MNSTILEFAIDQYNEHFYALVSLVLFCIFAGYLWIVLLAGPKFMKNREAFDITKVVQFYNICQVIVCSIYVIRSQMIGFTLNHLWKCERFEFLSDAIKFEVRVGFWFFLLVRLGEFWETIFFILRKKPNQASFLHIFHHIGSVLMTWLFIVMDAELMAVYIAIINSFVHIVMYSYYFMSSIKDPAIRKVANKVKPFITILQLAQFGVIITHCTVAILPDCDSSYFFHIQIVNFVVLTYLFGRFFVDSFISKKNDRKVDYHVAKA